METHTQEKTWLLEHVSVIFFSFSVFLSFFFFFFFFWSAFLIRNGLQSTLDGIACILSLVP